MSWAEQWSYKIDGTEVNDRTNFFTQVPELENTPQMDVILKTVDGDYPSFIRVQPKEMGYTFIIAMTPCTWATYQSRLQTLKTIFTPGTHTFTVQARGQASPTSVTIVATGSLSIMPKERIITISVIAPKPVFV